MSRDSSRKSEKNEHAIGDKWTNPVSGLAYEWNGECWVSTGRHPYGVNPMGLLGDGVP
jgi:hypothetical protein